MATLKLDNIPEEIYQLLERRAEGHGWSVSSEAVECLKASLAASPASLELENLREFRRQLVGVYVTDDDLEAAKAQGRP